MGPAMGGDRGAVHSDSSSAPCAPLEPRGIGARSHSPRPNSNLHSRSCSYSVQRSSCGCGSDAVANCRRWPPEAWWLLTWLHSWRLAGAAVSKHLTVGGAIGQLGRADFAAAERRERAILRL